MDFIDALGTINFCELHVRRFYHSITDKCYAIKCWAGNTCLDAATSFGLHPLDAEKS